MATQWTPDLVQRVGRMIADGVTSAALAERYGHRDASSFRASLRKAKQRAAKRNAGERGREQRASVGRQ